MTTWEGCYDASWRNLIVPDAFAHPAKMSRGLVVRIFDYLLTTGAVRRGDLVLDPFAGIFTTGIEGASRGVQVVGVELEPRFVVLAGANLALHRHIWLAMGCPVPVMVQGDSRRLRAVLAEARVDAVISSPPYEQALTGGTALWDHAEQKHQRAFTARSRTGGSYGDTDGQVGAMPSGGGVDAVVSSPPFTQGYSGGGGINVTGYGADGADKVGERTYQGTGAEREPGNLETLTLGTVEAVVSSPPFLGTLAVDGPTFTPYTGPGHSAYAPETAARRKLDYGTSEGQLGALPVDRVEAVVSSPPYEANTDRCVPHGGHVTDGEGGFRGYYGTDPANLGHPQGAAGETFWTAAAQIVRECHAILKPGGVAIWVVKAFVRDKKIVDFPGDWRRLCEHAGFAMVEEIHASLVQDTVHGDLFDGTRTTRRERKSFFRRLAEKKGSPRIDYEVVLVMVKP